MFFFFSSRRRHTRSLRDWSSDVSLPIWADAAPLVGGEQRGVQAGGHSAGGLARGRHGKAADAGDEPHGSDEKGGPRHQIGRASCRERVEISGVAAASRKKNNTSKTAQST